MQVYTQFPNALAKYSHLGNSHITQGSYTEGPDTPPVDEIFWHRRWKLLCRADTRRWTTVSIRCCARCSSGDRTGGSRSDTGGRSSSFLASFECRSYSANAGTCRTRRSFCLRCWGKLSTRNWLLATGLQPSLRWGAFRWGQLWGASLFLSIL